MLSELEGAVLSILLRNKALSAYAIRREFETSPTANWSASAGAIYPLIKRLTERGLIVDMPVRGDGRKTRLLTITRSGRSSVEDWVNDKSHKIFNPAADPLRTRGYALVAMSEDQQIRCLESWQTRTKTALNELRSEWDEEFSNQENGFAMLNYGPIFELEGRLRWIEMWLGKLNQSDKL